LAAKRCVDSDEFDFSPTTCERWHLCHMVMHVAMWQLLLGLFIVLGYPRDDTRSVGLLYSCYLIIILLLVNKH